MKGKTWKLWGILCTAVLLGMGLSWSKAQALDENRIYEVTGEEHFVFNKETQMITAYLDNGMADQSQVVDGVAQVPAIAVQQPATTVVIPRQIDGIDVKGLTGTFQGNKNIQKVIVPDTIVELGDDVFNGCEKLSSICVYRTDVPYLEQEVTENWNVNYVKMDGLIENVGEIGPNTTEAPDSTSEPIATEAPDSTSEPVATEAPDSTSEPGSTQAPVVLPDTSTETDGDTGYYEIIDKGNNCAVIPASLQSVGQRTFNSCAFVGFEVLEGSEYFKDSGEGGTHLQEGVGASLLSLDGTKLYRIAPRYRDQNNTLEYSIPEGVEVVMPYAGQGLGDKHEVKIADSVKTIDSYAFYESGLLRITFTENAQVETIGDWTFAYNDNLEITLPTSVKTIGKYSFAYITNRTPDLSKTQITVIPEHTFEGCPNLHTITMPPTLQVIEKEAFAGNANLNEVVFTGDSLTSIGEGAFQNCQNMHKINIPAGVTTIEANTFKGCSNLNEVILPEGLVEIKDEAFSNCQNIHTMVIPSTVTSIAGNSFSGSNTQDIDTSKNAYAQSAIGGKVTVPTQTTAPMPKMPGVGYQKTIGKLVYKVTGTGTVTLVKPVSKSIKKVTIPATVKIDGFTFKVTAVSAKAFAGCKKLKTVTIGANVSSIGKQAFKNCKKLSKITIRSKKLTKGKVGAGAFKGIAKKATIKVPKKKYKAYKKFLRKKGIGKKVKIKK
ncbi:MAG: leucine-rich repeat domain-containing protein [Lachnospiraceae bacterium]|nr:leucine-rich repeat domain-containing protein [Lachnospiraceae bacterium]